MFLCFQEFVSFLKMGSMPNLGLNAEAASFLGFSEPRAAEAKPATPYLAQPLAFSSCKEQTNQLGKQAWCFDSAYS